MFSWKTPSIGPIPFKELLSFLLKISFILFYVSEGFAYMYVYTHRSQKRASDPLGLEL